MKVVLLAGGFGTRISEESQFKPKPMIEIGGKPILWHIMKEYASFGFSEFVICTGYKQHVIKEYFSNYALYNSDITFDFQSENKMKIHNNFSEPWKVTIVDTGLNSLTGWRIKLVQPYIGDEQTVKRQRQEAERTSNRWNGIRQPGSIGRERCSQPMIQNSQQLVESAKAIIIHIPPGQGCDIARNCPGENKYGPIETASDQPLAIECHRNQYTKGDMEKEVGNRPDNIKKKNPPKIVVRNRQIIRQNINEILKSNPLWRKTGRSRIQWVKT